MVYESWLLLNLHVNWKQTETAIHTPHQLKSHTNMTDSSIQQKNTDNRKIKVSQITLISVSGPKTEQRKRTTLTKVCSYCSARWSVPSTAMTAALTHSHTYKHSLTHTHGGEIKNNRSRSTHIQAHKCERGNAASCASVRQRGSCVLTRCVTDFGVFYVWKKFVFSWTRGGAYREKFRPLRARPAPTNILSSLHRLRDTCSKHNYRIYWK